MSTEIKQGYSFSKEKHLHMLDGKALTGTTTVLQVIAKPALIPWAVKTCKDFLVAVLKSGATITPELIEEAGKQHRLKKEKAGDWGTDLHAMIESYAKTGMALSPKDEKMEEAFNHFLSWTSTNKVKFLDSEKNVYSPTMWVGGICDLVVEIDGKVWLADVKTGSGIYPEHFWQMASYQMCLQEMGLYPNVEGYIVLNLKKDGTFEEKRSISNEENQSAFKAALTIYRIQEKLNKQVI